MCLISFIMHPTCEFLIKCNEKLKAVGVRNAIKFPFQFSTLNYLSILHRHFGANAEVHENDAPPKWSPCGGAQMVSISTQVKD